MQKFMLLLRDGEDNWSTFSPTEIQQLMERYLAWTSNLAAEGKLIHADRLQARGRVVTMPTGAATDGPFVETKDAIGGYYMITAADLDEATVVAQECPVFAHGGYVEVRAVYEQS